MPPELSDSPDKFLRKTQNPKLHKEEMSMSAQFSLNQPIERTQYGNGGFMPAGPSSKLGQYYPDSDQPMIHGHATFHHHPIISGSKL